MRVLSCVQLFATQWTVAHQAPLSIDFQARILEWVVISYSIQTPCGDQINQMVSCSHLFPLPDHEQL